MSSQLANCRSGGEVHQSILRVFVDFWQADSLSVLEGKILPRMLLETGLYLGL